MLDTLGHSVCVWRIGSSEAVDQSSYRFRSLDRTMRWPRGAPNNLGAAGMWNFLWRLGLPARMVAECPADGSAAPLFVQIDGPVSTRSAAALHAWVERGGRAIISGIAEEWSKLGFDNATWRTDEPEHPTSGLSYLMPNKSPLLVAPSGWTFGTREDAGSLSKATVEGTIGVVGGERQTPSRALISPVYNAPAITLADRCVFLNGDPFAAMQAWLQGQESLRPWLGWHHRLHWIDEWISGFAGLLARLGMLDLSSNRGIAGLPETTVVLRHDLDYSRDVSYLEHEVALRIPATHAVLLDQNRAFWINRITPHAEHEVAFHYTTGERRWLATLGNRLLRRPGTSVWGAKKRGIGGGGLLRQVRRARKLGVDVATLHRHLAFVLYPEWIDAMHYVFEHEPDVLGSSSTFRAAPLRWGNEVAEVSDWPDVESPFWFPFRLSHAAHGGSLLRGWESTSLLEPEPELVENLLDHKIPFLPQRVFTLGFHPAHAAKPTFARDGSLAQFRDTVRLLEERKVEFRTLRDVYIRAAAALS